VPEQKLQRHLMMRWTTAAQLFDLLLGRCGAAVSQDDFGQSTGGSIHSARPVDGAPGALFSSPQKAKSFQDSPSHRILHHMHRVLNINENKN